MRQKNTLIESRVDKFTNGNQLGSRVAWPLDLQVWNGVDRLKLDGTYSGLAGSYYSCR